MNKNDEQLKQRMHNAHVFFEIAQRKIDSMNQLKTLNAADTDALSQCVTHAHTHKCIQSINTYTNTHDMLRRMHTENVNKEPLPPKQMPFVTWEFVNICFFRYYDGFNVPIIGISFCCDKPLLHRDELNSNSHHI